MEVRLSKFLSQITPDNIHDEVDTGKPVGKEVVVYNRPPKNAIIIDKDDWYPGDDIYSKLLDE